MRNLKIILIAGAVVALPDPHRIAAGDEDAGQAPGTRIGTCL